MTTVAEAGEVTLAASVPLLNCKGCSTLLSRLDDVGLVSVGRAHGNTTIDRKPVFFSRKFSSGVVFETLHILKMPVCTSVQKIHSQFININTNKHNCRFLADRTNGHAIATLFRLSVRPSVTLCIVAKRCVLEQKLLLTAYRKSYIRNRLVPKWMTLTFV